MVARMRKLFLAIALIIVASVGSSGRPAAQIMFHPGGRHDVHLTLHNTSDACVWVTVYDERPVELGTAVLEPGRSWFRELVSSGLGRGTQRQGFLHHETVSYDVARMARAEPSDPA